jgi:protease I
MPAIDQRVAMIVKDNFEQSEMEETRQLLQAAGITVDLVGIEVGEVQGLEHVEKGDTFTTDKALKDISPDDYDGVVLPGGAVNADELRIISEAQDFVSEMYNTGKVVAAICHAPWLLVSAGIAEGHTLTSFPTIKDDIENAGGIWVEEEVSVDDNIITSRNPNDIPAFSEAIITALTVVEE